MQHNEKFWIAIPVFNHLHTLREIIDEIQKIHPHILVVDDGSTDGNVNALLDGTLAIIIRHDFNKGKGAALMTGSSFIGAQGGTYMITLDADGQHAPGDIKTFIASLDFVSKKIYIGTRDFKGKKIPFLSRLGRSISNFAIFLETGKYVPDTQSGFRAYPVALLNSSKYVSGHFAFETEIIVRAARAGYDIIPIDISVSYPTRKERISHFKIFTDNLRILILHFRIIAEILSRR